ncbi:MAG: hypothetical protein WBG19_02750 [Thermoplasmata archaeon]
MNRDDKDVPPEHLQQFERARKAALENPERSDVNDPHSARAWEMDPTHRGRFSASRGIPSTRFEEPLLPASDALAHRKLGSIGMIVAGVLIAGVTVVLANGVPGTLLIFGCTFGGLMAGIGSVSYWWLVHQGQPAADRGLLYEFE